MWVANYNTGTKMNRINTTTPVNTQVEVGATKNDVVFDGTNIWVTLPTPHQVLKLLPG